MEDLPDDLTPSITRIAMDHVGAGSYGDVWKCNYTNANGISTLVSPCVGFNLLCNWLIMIGTWTLIDKVAVKAFKLPDHYDLETLNRKISREIGILKILHHGNIVPLLGIATGFGSRPELRCIVSPWMPNGTLNAYLVSNHNHLTVLDRSRMLEDVSAGLRYLHSIPVMHCDITGANILIDEGGHARLIDFGLSTITKPLLGQSHLAVTSIHHGAIPYAAPELILPETTCDPGLEEKSDIYSFGCVMLQILSGRPPWSEITAPNRMACIITQMSRGCRPQRPDGHPEIIDSDWKFIQKCLQSEPELRPSADEVLDFVMHRFSFPDSCSKLPDDHPDDAPDDFPGTSPHGGSNDSDTAEQPPDSPPLHPDDELKTLFTVADTLSASTSTAPAFHVSSFSHNDSSNEVSESSTTPGHGHSLEEVFQCKCNGPDGLSCDNLIQRHDLSSHLREVHGIRGSPKLIVMCIWDGCSTVLKKESLLRHMEEVHLRVVYSCDCGKRFKRKDLINAHRRKCTVISSSS
ncbi:kinase-like domain-containing protein [Suillus plorans]|uniref:Kinase-like domain-containing protein n=1 Tax=Suillus plorans TaxID=116603 RepID=A0A9P7DHF2_9AGAM|nr:kinase-like domain-containing protein [Suillus plorans]KAG1792980.1 kinase-like domain-containing protein [Suillus plorans]